MEQVASQFLSDNITAVHLLVALMLGMLVGLERGWSARDKDAGQRVAGIRTFALIGLLGGIAALLSEALSSWIFPVVFLSVSGLCAVAYWRRNQSHPDYSITGLVGLLLTFCFGGMAVAVDVTLATASAVVTALVLDNKREIHDLLLKLQASELDAALKLLLISVVMLPLLPNRSMGPGGALNPYEIWWMVVLIASISFVGYFAVRVAGTGRGILFTSLFAGLSSSTALTLHFSRQSRDNASLSPQLASGILIACGTMFPRILIYCLVISPALLASLTLPVAVMAISLYVPAAVIWVRNRQRLTVDQPELHMNPLDLKSALFFGALLTAILLVGTWLQDWFGDAGVYLLAATSGVADVDAITLSLTRMSQSSITAQTAVIGIVLASAVNNLVKSAMAALIGTRALALRVGLPMLMSLLLGLVAALVFRG
ncbi:MgtC/SapB family protein [Marinobacter sp. JSM 1782161]|uniref:MgtC/SapB family protein n=1 Tax=Marinobacter sp. JSM 1782161 TaxID=2685906 RepID=UPI0014036AD3|nr:MgtC/SapB family protein [Marinobacter sp. JSM 1782161]